MPQQRETDACSVALTERCSSSPVADRGLGLIEIVIAMFLISLLAIAFVPVLVTALRASEVNSTAATATRLVAQALDDARARGAADCASAQLLNATTDTIDAQDVTLRVVTSVPPVASCAAGSALPITAVAYDLADASRTPIADARTLLFLDGTP